MKMEKVFDVVGFVWVSSLMLMFAFAIGYAVFALCTGDYHGTAAFEF